MAESDSNLFRNEITRNPYVWGAITLCFLLLAIALYVPLFARALALHIPNREGWLLIITGSSIPLIIGRLVIWGKKIFTSSKTNKFQKISSSQLTFTNLSNKPH